MEKPEKGEADSQASSNALSCKRCWRLEGMQAWLRAHGHSGGEVLLAECNADVN